MPAVSDFSRKSILKETNMSLNQSNTTASSENVLSDLPHPDDLNLGPVPEEISSESFLSSESYIFQLLQHKNYSERANEQLQQIRTPVHSLLNRTFNPTTLIITHRCRPTMELLRLEKPRTSKTAADLPSAFRKFLLSRLCLLWGLDWPEWPGDTCRTAIWCYKCQRQFW